MLAVLHAGAPPAPHDFWTAWSNEPFVWLGLIALTASYGRGVREAWQRAGRGRVFGTGELRAAALALTALLVALISPIDALGSALFAGHMVQHLLLVAVAAPLLVRADAAAALLRSLPVRLRRKLVRSARRSGAWYAWQALSQPGPALLLHAGTLWLWHMPAYYDAAVASNAVHALEHASMLGTALLFWRPLLARSARARMQPGVALLYLFVFGMQSSLLGALLTFAERPWFQAHLASAAPWGLTPLDDQRLAGVIMWVPGGVLYLAAAARVFLQWLAEMERRSPAAARILPILLLLLLGACGSELDADQQRGRALIREKGCGACHDVPGVRGARGAAGPPLWRFGERTLIAGNLPNDRANLVRFLLNPQVVEPGTAMPNLGLTPAQAGAIASYLHTLR